MQSLCFVPITEISSLLRTAPPLCSALVLSLLQVLCLSFSLFIKTTGSRVLYISLCKVHATSMPAAIWSAIRSSSRFIPEVSMASGFDDSYRIFGTSSVVRFHSSPFHLLDFYYEAFSSVASNLCS